MDHGQQIQDLYNIIYKLINDVESLKKINDLTAMPSSDQSLIQPSKINKTHMRQHI